MDMRRNMAGMEEMIIYENSTARTILVPKPKQGPCKTCGKLTRSHKDMGKFQCHVCFEHPDEHLEIKEESK